MSAKHISLSIADALPEADNPRDELVALGMVAAAIICQTEPQGRAELVDVFCQTLRRGVSTELN